MHRMDGDKRRNKVPLASVIMPVFNEEKTVAQAIESALFQQTDFDFELIVIDDGSSDATPKIVERYTAAFPNVRTLVNNQRSGKGTSVIRGYAAARGKYFHVLDGDDLFLSWNKLAIQVEFLEKNEDFFAVGHNTAILYPDDSLAFIRSAIEPQVYEYSECIANGLYCHTSSYLFRKLGHNLPDYFMKEPMRGDTALFFYHAYNHKTKVMYFPDVASIYNFHGSGLWSGLSVEERDTLNIACLECLRDLVVNDDTTEEHESLQTRINAIKDRTSNSVVAKAKAKSLDELVEFCAKSSSRVFTPQVKDEAFKGMYSFKSIDQLCELAGRIITFRNGYTIADRNYNSDRIALLVSGFVPNGGGIFREIKELVAIFLEAGFKISIISSAKIPTERSIIHEHFSHPNIEYWHVDSTQKPSVQLETLIEKIWQTAPARIYPFITHHDAVLNASLQRGLGEHIVLDFVYDHGLSFAIHNTAIDKIIVKTGSQASALAPRLNSQKFLFVPPFIVDKYKRNPYEPLRNGKLTTASAAARAYKVENDYRYSYLRIISDVLAITGGTHFHYGPLSADALQNVREELERNAIEPGCFVHIPWADDLGGSFLEQGIDLFFAPFPLCSARIAIEIMSCGIPSINHHAESPTLPQAIDFVDPHQWTWNTPENLYRQVRAMTPKVLRERSESAREYFLTHNDSAVAASHILEMTGIELKHAEGAASCVIKDIAQSGLIDLSPEFFEGAPKATEIQSVSETKLDANEKKSEPKKGLWRRLRPLRRAIRSYLYAIMIAPLMQSSHRLMSWRLKKRGTRSAKQGLAKSAADEPREQIDGPGLNESGRPVSLPLGASVQALAPAVLLCTPQHDVGVSWGPFDPSRSHTEILSGRRSLVRANRAD